MTEEKTVYISKEGLEQLQNELSYLKNQKRREVADRIQQAKELGDLSENAEYVEAKNEQGFVEGRILEIEMLLRNATVIQQKKNNDMIGVGSVVRVKTGETTVTYTIVGSSEADPGSGKISNESPLGQLFLDKKVGDEVVFHSPRGPISYTVESIG